MGTVEGGKLCLAERKARRTTRVIFFKDSPCVNLETRNKK